MIKRLKTLERPAGVGQVYNDGKLVCEKVRYQLNVYQEMIDTSDLSGPSETGGLKGIEGTVSAEMTDVLKMTYSNALRLHLQDGRKLNIVFQGNGRITGNGGFED